MRSKLLGWSSLMLVVLAGAAVPSCSGGAAGLCNAMCDCEQCAPWQFDSCMNENDADQATADYRGCSAQYSDYIACQNATGVCYGTDWHTSCGYEHDLWKHCVDWKK